MIARLRALDALRTIAVVLVLGRHMPEPPATLAWRGALVEWMRFGWIGVDLFFVLSGFLVSGLLFTERKRHGRLRIGRFLVRRGFKIYPPFYLLIAISVAVAQPTAKKLLAELFFFQNYTPGIWNHTWSLAVEEHFYLLLALVLLLWSRSKTAHPATLAVAIGLGLVATLALRLFSLARNPNAFPMYQTHYRLDALGFGVLLSLAYHFAHDRLATFVHRWRWGLLAAAVCLLTPALWLGYRDRWMLGFGLTTNYLGFGLVLLLTLLSGWSLPRFLDAIATGLARVGQSSYSIYLWHVPILAWLMPRTAELPHAARLVIYFPFCILIGVVFGRLIEQPFLRLRDRISPA